MATLEIRVGTEKERTVLGVSTVIRRVVALPSGTGFQLPQQDLPGICSEVGVPRAQTFQITCICGGRS